MAAWFATALEFVIITQPYYLGFVVVGTGILEACSLNLPPDNHGVSKSVAFKITLAGSLIFF